MSNKIDISLARLIAQCACFIIVTSICYHKSTGTHSIVIEHVVETQLFVSVQCCTLDLGSCSLGRTSGLGLELVSRFKFLGQITGEIVPLSYSKPPPPHTLAFQASSILADAKEEHRATASRLKAEHSLDQD